MMVEAISSLEIEPGGKKRAWLAYTIVMVLTLIWLSGIIAAPLLASGRVGSTGILPALLYYFYGRVCHQLPGRAYWILGEPLAVCSRCLGIYFGFLAGLILYPMLRNIEDTVFPARRWLVIGLVPLAVDFMGGFLGVFENTHFSRLLVGIIAGGVVVFYTLPGFIEISKSPLRFAVFGLDHNQTAKMRKEEHHV